MDEAEAMKKEIKAQPYTKKIRTKLQHLRGRIAAAGRSGRYSPIYAAVTGLKRGECVIVPPSVFNGSNDWPAIADRVRVSYVGSAARRWQLHFRIRCRTYNDGSVVIIRIDDN